MAKTPMDKLVENNTNDCLWVYILRILSDGDIHAYMLRGRIEEKFGFRPGMVTAYRVLYALVTMGMVESRMEGRKKIYKITKNGESELVKAVSFYRNMCSTLERAK